jgi:hypothetical protein
MMGLFSPSLSSMFLTEAPVLTLKGLLCCFFQRFFLSLHSLSSVKANCSVVPDPHQLASQPGFVRLIRAVLGLD